MAKVQLGLRRISWTGSGRSFTAFIAMTDLEFDVFTRADKKDLQPFRDRIMHLLEGGTPSDSDIEAAHTAFRHRYSAGP